MKFYLLGEDNEKVEIEVLSRTHPKSTDFWDGNWIDSNIHVEIPGYTAQFMACLRTDELSYFLDGLNTMHKMLKGKAILENLDEYIHFECEMNNLGHIEWKGKTCYPNGFGAELTFEFKSNQSYLEQIIRDLNRILAVFPVIGKP